MTTALQATEAVYKLTRTSWAVALGYGLTFEGEHYTPADGATWARVKVADRASEPPSHGPTGGRHIQRRGAVLAQVFVPWSPTDGVKLPLARAATFRALFEGTDLATVGGGSLSFAGCDVRRIGVSGKNYQVNVECPFTYDDVI